MNGFGRISVFLIIFALIFSWFFSGWPRVFNLPPKVQVAQAAVAHNTASESHTASIGSTNQASFSWSHAGAASGVKGILVFTFVNANADDALSVTYGGSSLAAVSGGRAVDTANEPGDCKAWFLGSSVPQGTQTVVVNRNNNANVMYAVAVTVTANTDTYIVGTPVLLQENGTIAEQNVDSGSNFAVRYACDNSGLGTHPAAGANSTELHFFPATAGTRSISTVLETTGGSGSRPVGFSAATDDRAAVHLAIAENSTTLGSGTGDPAATTIAPGASATDIDSFTFITSAGTDNITQATTTFSTDISAGVSEVQITDNAGSTNYGTSTLSGTAASITLSPNIVASSTSEQYKIRVVPKSHSAMSVPPGAAYTATATISAWTGTNAQLGSDSNANVLTIDNLSPNGATVTSGSAGNAKVTLNWTTSNSSDFDTTNGSVILRWASGSAGSEVPAEGNSSYSAGNTIGTATVACVISSAGSTALSKIDGSGGDAGCTTAALTNGQQYTYKVFQRDTRGNYDVGVSIGTFTPVANQTPSVSAVNISPSPIILTENGTTTVTVTATITDNDGCGDVLNNGTTTATLYRSSLGASCTQDFNNCYVDIRMTSTTCAGTSGNASGTVQVWYIAQATDASSSFSGDTWQTTVKAIDAANASSTATDGTPPELSTLLAIDVTSSISYGTVNPNATSTTQTITITNTGNYNTLDVQFSGVNLESGANNIPVGQQKYSTTTSEAWDYMDFILSGTAALRELNIVKATATTSPSTQNNFWAIQVPVGAAVGTYTGTTTISAY